jgi:hypothetical protein
VPKIATTTASGKTEQGQLVRGVCLRDGIASQVVLPAPRLEGAILAQAPYKHDSMGETRSAWIFCDCQANLERQMSSISTGPARCWPHMLRKIWQL